MAIEPTQEAGRQPATSDNSAPTMGTNLASNDLEVDVSYLYHALQLLTVTNYPHRMILTLSWTRRKLIAAIRLIYLISVNKGLEPLAT